MVAVRMEQDRDSRTQTSLPQLESERCSTGGVSGIERHHGLDPQYDVVLNATPIWKPSPNACDDRTRGTNKWGSSTRGLSVRISEQAERIASLIPSIPCRHL
jgi:hypothetical protein